MGSNFLRNNSLQRSFDLLRSRHRITYLYLSKLEYILKLYCSGCALYIFFFAQQRSGGCSPDLYSFFLAENAVEAVFFWKPTRYYFWCLIEAVEAIFLGQFLKGSASFKLFKYNFGFSNCYYYNYFSWAAQSATIIMKLIITFMINFWNYCSPLLYNEFCQVIMKYTWKLLSFWIFIHIKNG